MVKIRWNTYKDHPGASFLSFSLNFVGLPLLLGIGVFISGLSRMDAGLIFGGAGVVAAFVLYIIIVTRYLRKFDPLSQVVDAMKQQIKNKKR